MLQTPNRLAVRRLGVVLCRSLLATGAVLLAFAMTPLLTKGRPSPTTALVNDARVVKALEWIDKNGAWITQQQIKITEVPAPEFQEGPRAQLVRKLLEGCGLKARIDSTGNVVAEYAGSANGVLLLAAHLDTVFPAGTNVTVRQSGTRLTAPGIGDNGAGLGALLAIARAMHETKLKTHSTIVFAADVGEEGEGNLRGIRALVEHYGVNLRAVIAVDGYATDYITTRALASQRMEITITGSGGHSWSDFGLPNPITALSRGIVRFSGVRIPSDPRTTFNFGVIEGGTSVNSIPQSASVRLDLRSEDDSEIKRLDAAVRKAFQRGLDEELEANGRSAPLELSYKMLGTRPGGVLPEDSPLLAAARDADRILRNSSRLEISSTDANIPLSLGIPAIALGGGGDGGGAHTLQEWYEPAEREMGVKRVLLTLLGIAGVSP